MSTSTASGLASHMDAARWQRIKNILADSLAQTSPAARAQIIRNSCAADTALFRDVQSLLAHETSAIDALEDCAEKAADVFGRDRSLAGGDRIGAYEIQSELGHGGMGAVYRAARADGTFEKEVAIKILKRGTDTDETLRRFQAERQILARLDHPNIARLLDAGTTADGLPYFVMDYVSGEPITIFAREKNLSIAERLRLFRKVCEAVQFAHTQRVVHRDLKANNILVQANGEPRLLDFGIAKLITDENTLDLTGPQQRRFTPTCASPEQARGETVTPISDVYTLGALLYELLTETTPHRFGTTRPSADEVARVVCEEEPLPPSLVAKQKNAQRRLRGDLDNIVLMAMRKEPARRYQSVAALAVDLDRYLSGRSTQARPLPISHRAQRIVARHRREAIVLALLLAAVLSVLAWRRQTATTLSATVEEKSIAVLPFENRGGDEANAYFAEGVEDNIATDLARLADLKVINPNSTRLFRERQQDVREIGHSLGVARLLRGSVQRAGNHLRISAQLIDTRDSAQLWAEQYDRQITDLFAIQNEVAQEIVQQLRHTFSPGEKIAAAPAPTNDFEAYDLFLRARALVRDFTVGPTFGANAAEAIELLHQAIARDPNFAAAYRLLSEMHLYLYRYNNDTTPERVAQLKRAMETAVRLAPDAPESHLTKARYFYYCPRDFAAAEEELRLAAPALPNDASLAELSALTARRRGGWALALRDGRRCVELDPRTPRRLLQLSETYHALRRFREAEDAADHAIAALAPKAAEIFWWQKSLSALGRNDEAAARLALEKAAGELAETRLRLVLLLISEKHFDQAEKLVDSLMPQRADDHRLFLARSRLARARGDRENEQASLVHARDLLTAALAKDGEDPTLLARLGPIEAQLHEREEALRAGKRAIELAPSARDAIDGPEYEGWLAKTYSQLGESDQAFAILERLVKSPCAPTPGELNFDPDWENLRSDPRFASVVAAAGVVLGQ